MSKFKKLYNHLWLKKVEEVCMDIDVNDAKKKELPEIPEAVMFCRKIIDRVVPDIQNKKLAVYPCGERCDYVVDYLKNEYGLSVDLMIDNYKEHCICTYELKHIDYSDYVFLIASDSSEYYKKIRKEIRKYVPENRVIDLFPAEPPKNRERLNRFLRRILYPHGKGAFLHTVKNSPDTKILDVGCGNGSPQYVKTIINKGYYVGIDVRDYNQTKETKEYADEYFLVKSELFAEKIEEYKEVFDVVISSHNLEHCDEPEKVLLAMIRALKKGGKLYLAFPSEESQYFPEGGRKGCLNFYDDPSHQNVLNWKKINAILKKERMKIVFRTKNNRPFLMSMIGELNEEKSKECKTVLLGTWEYYGFESILWCKKR